RDLRPESPGAATTLLGLRRQVDAHGIDDLVARLTQREVFLAPGATSIWRQLADDPLLEEVMGAGERVTERAAHGHGDADEQLRRLVKLERPSEESDLSQVALAGAQVAARGEDAY